MDGKGQHTRWDCLFHWHCCWRCWCRWQLHSLCWWLPHRRCFGTWGRDTGRVQSKALGNDLLVSLVCLVWETPVGLTNPDYWLTKLSRHWCEWIQTFLTPSGLIYHCSHQSKDLLMQPESFLVARNVVYWGTMLKVGILIVSEAQCLSSMMFVSILGAPSCITISGMTQHQSVLSSLPSSWDTSRTTQSPILYGKTHNFCPIGSGRYGSFLSTGSYSIIGCYVLSISMKVRYAYLIALCHESLATWSLR